MHSVFLTQGHHMLLTISMTLLTVIIIPVYWKQYGMKNFLWLSDIGLFMTVIALWLHSLLLMSMAAVGILFFEIIWVIDYFYALTTRKSLLGLTSYMFDPKYSLFLRSLSLFHIPLPIIWIYCLLSWGYDPRAFAYQSILVSTVLILSYILTDPQENTNLVFTPEKHNWQQISSRTWVLLLIVMLPLCVFWPIHKLFVLLFA